MAAIAVSVTMGAMKPVLDKLATLLGDKYKKVKGLRGEVEFLNSELRDMTALLEKMDETDELDPQANNWRKDIIDMSYDIEDYIDDFTSRVGEAGDDAGALQKASHFLRTFKDRNRIASRMKKIKAKVIEASKRRKRYNLDQCIRSSTHRMVDPRLSVLYQKSLSLVGIDGQIQEIVRWAMDEGQQLKMMAIVGFGGLGKTTLANEVYRELGGKFDCKAFISVSQNPNIIKLLKSLMFQLRLEQPYPDACEADLINSIIEYLQGKRYLIIIDDLWDDRQAWRTISCTFPRNNCNSRVMITSRIENVARECCGNHGRIHNMKPLSEQDSIKLFFDRIGEAEDDYPPDFIEASSKILKKCGGLPLAIVTMSSMIACEPTRSMGQLAEYIQESLGTKFSANPSYEDMMYIIDFSYKNLPRHLKACFLYLGTYPEDHKIRRSELVRRWVAEGFVSCSDGQDVWDVADRYFSELANRTMIQPAYEEYDDTGSNVTHCRVHDMMLQLIVRKCKEDNFVSLIDAPETMSQGQDKLIRRLAVGLRRGVDDDGGGGITLTGSNLSQVRSVSIFRGSSIRIPKVTEFKFMRLLFLDVDNCKTTIDLTDINHLSQLRYLHVMGGGKVLFPAQIRGLRHLETVELSEYFGDHSCSLPPEIVDVPRLSHLSMPRTGVRLPDGIGNVKSLLTLSGFDLAMSSLESITSLGELTDLSVLWLTCYNMRYGGGTTVLMPMMVALIDSLKKLGNLRILTLVAVVGDGLAFSGTMFESSFSPAFRKIEGLDLGPCIFSSVPTWIQHLLFIRNLTLGVKQIHQQDLDSIGRKLTSLLTLTLLIVHVPTPTERIVIGGSTGFKVLRRFALDCYRGSCLTFEAGAMPNVLKLKLMIDPYEWDEAAPVGLQHLPSLKTILVQPFRSLETNPAQRYEPAAWRPLREWPLREVFQQAVDALPTTPTLEMKCVRVRRRYIREF